VLSPALFCVYIDDMLLHMALPKTGVGCYIGNVFIGALAYADDVVIIAPSACAMRRLLNVCDNCVNEYHIIFNAEKFKCCAFLSKNRRSLSEHRITGLFNIGNNPIECVQSFTYKIVFGLVSDAATNSLYSTSTRSRGHAYKLYPQNSRTDLRQCFFSEELLNRGTINLLQLIISALSRHLSDL
jgi:Reverse transcriptase (RNA-dependent DNA polymerase)